MYTDSRQTHFAGLFSQVSEMSTEAASFVWIEIRMKTLNVAGSLVGLETASTESKRGAQFNLCARDKTCMYHQSDKRL